MVASPKENRMRRRIPHLKREGARIGDVENSESIK